ncbi:MAG: N-6 DNA methylase [Bacteroidetes bacterium]|nr:N-6 DNA methylase [Bacteroidota bacterium]
MAAAPACRFGLWVGQELRGYEKGADGQIARISDIPRFGHDQPQRPTRDALVPTHELTSVFRRCHNYIYANTGLQKADAFHELIKLIFCKSFDEEESGHSLQFAISPAERRSTSGQRRLMEDRLGPLFDRVKERYPFIFDGDDKIRIEAKVAAYLVSELQFFSILSSEADVKGAAYEELVGANLRGDRGEYFTPRNVCNMTARMCMSLYDTTDLTSLTVLDCCCGTGGFLIAWLNNLYQVLLEQESSRPSTNTPASVRARMRVKDVCQRNLFGLDINPKLVRACQLNLVLHGDGSSNVFRADSTRLPGEWSSRAARDIPYGGADLVITNPPFVGNARIDDAHVLEQYELPRCNRGDMTSSMPAEQLFLEAALKFLKPGGYLAIVLPDGILNNPGLKFIRSWLLRRSKLIASVDLPKTTFASSGGVKNPSVLIAQRLTPQETQDAENGILEHAYEVFLATPNTAGINLRANPIYLRHADGMEIEDESRNKIIDDEVAHVHEAFAEWWSSRNIS